MANEHPKDNDINVDSHSVKNSPSSGGGQHNNHSAGDAARQQQQHLHNLRTFQELVGIRTPPHILSTGSIPSQQLLNLEQQERDLEKASKLPPTTGIPPYETQAAGRPNRSWKDLFFRSLVENEGIYGRAIDEALKASVGYNASTWFINSLYVFQIFVAATITGLASYHGHEIPLTVLGAVNAVLAGLMALIKGQGLPVRLRRSRDQFENVIKTIENRERMFARFAYMDPNKYVPAPAVAPKVALPDPFEEYQKCVDLYDAAKRDQQANYPDLYSNTNEILAVQQLNNNNRLGGLGIYGSTNPDDIKAQNAALQAQLAAITAKLDETIKTTADALKGIKSGSTDSTAPAAAGGGTSGANPAGANI